MPHAEAPRGGASCVTFSFILFFSAPPYRSPPSSRARSCLTRRRREAELLVPPFLLSLYFSCTRRRREAERPASPFLLSSFSPCLCVRVMSHGESLLLSRRVAEPLRFSPFQPINLLSSAPLRAPTLFSACDNAVLARPLRRDRAASTPQSPRVYGVTRGPLRGSRGRASLSCVRQRPAAHLQKRINGLKNDTFFQIIGQYFCAVSK